MKAIGQGGETGDNYFRNQHGALGVGRHVCMLTLQWMILSKLKGFSFNKENVIEVVVPIGSSLHLHGERDCIFLSSRKNSDRVHEHFDLVKALVPE